METFSALLALCAGNSPVTLCREIPGHRWIPAQRPVTRSFDVFFDLRPNKRLSKQSLCCGLTQIYFTQPIVVWWQWSNNCECVWRSHMSDYTVKKISKTKTATKPWSYFSMHCTCVHKFSNETGKCTWPHLSTDERHDVSCEKTGNPSHRWRKFRTVMLGSQMS